MDTHPINTLMEKALESIKKMLEVNTIVGEAIETKSGTIIIPVTKLSCGFGAGGSEYAPKNLSANEDLPFGGGSGGGVSIQPVGFLVIKNDDIRFQMVNDNVLWDRLIEEVPEFILKLKHSFNNSPDTPSEQLYTDDGF